MPKLPCREDSAYDIKVSEIKARFIDAFEGRTTVKSISDELNLPLYFVSELATQIFGVPYNKAKKEHNRKINDRRKLN